MSYSMFLLLDYMEKISQAYPDLDLQLLLMSDMTRNLIHADRCTIWLHDDITYELWSKVAHGVDRMRIPDDKGVAGHVFVTGEMYLVNDVSNDEFYFGGMDNKTGYNTKSMIAVPLKYSDGATFGVFQILNKLDDNGNDGCFNDIDIEISKMTAHFCEQALINSVLDEKVKNAQRDMIFLLSDVVENRSLETANHVHRVSDICMVLGKLYGLNEEMLATIHLVAALHDVGKIAVPDAVLNKPGKLTDEEREIMQTHSATGYKILKKFDTKMMNMAADIAHEHHERYDGKGYPRGIAGEDISIYARIAAVADVFDALACERVYKKPWPKEKIIALFQEEKGKQFDPVLTQLFLDNVDMFFDILSKYSDSNSENNDESLSQEVYK